MSESALVAALDEGRRLGMLGDRPAREVIEHGRMFVEALRDVRGVVIDLGAGGGAPGLVIAHDRPDLHLVLVDRRTKRTDHLERVVRRLGVADRVDVRASDAEDLVREGVAADAVVARGFGPPAATLRLAVALLRAGGVAVISEPPVGDRWSASLLDELHLASSLVSGPSGSVRRFQLLT